MKYEQELTFQLRLRGRSEREIAETLRELRAHGVGPSELRDEFGTPQEYASGFERSKRRTLGTRVTSLGVIAAVAWIVAWITVGLVRTHAFGIEPALDGLLDRSWVSFGAVGIAAAGVLGGFLTDLLRPAPRILSGALTRPE